jgi:polyisoprenoid-binding protein YceI
MKQFFVLSIFVMYLITACSPAVTVPASTAVNNENLPSSTLPSPVETPAAVNGSKQPGLITYKIIPGESQVTYEVGETFLNQSNRFNLAVGVTKQVTGEILANQSDPQKSSIGPITVDISQFTSDSSRRDSAIRGMWLESGKFPQAIFTPTKIETLPSTYVEGQDYSFKVTGDLKVRDVTKPVTFDVTVNLKGGTLSGTAVTTILMSDFGVGPISIGGMLNTEDKAKVSLKFVARP